MKRSLDAIQVAYTNLNMAFFVETGIGIEWFAFGKKTPHCIITS
jgi:hypothetical protein